MAGDLEPAGADKPGNDLEGSVPDGRPSQWPDTLFDTVVSWAFLGAIVEHHRVRPWLVLEQRPSGMGPVSFVVPRLVPEAGWHDSLAYRAWLESASRADSTPLPSVLTVAEAAEQLPPSPTRPRWANQERLVNVAVRADLVGRSSAQIVEEDGEANLPSDRARAVRKEIASARAFLATLKALPWAAFDEGRLATHGSHWWTDRRFTEGLALWRADATNLSWRHARESGPATDPVREAATVLMREPWRPGHPLVLTHARGLLDASAREFQGTCQSWLEGFIGSPQQTAECRADLVHRADMNGSTAELRSIWDAAKAVEPLVGRTE
jgi:hypothetical protein